MAAALVISCAVRLGAAGSEASLREAVANALRASRGGEASAFHRAVGELETAIAAAPPGSQREQAVEALRICKDLDRVWTYQYESPSGAFFDASTGLVEIMQRHRGYSAFIAPRVVRTGERTFYPVRETRDFLVGEAQRAAESARTIAKTAASAAPRKARAAPPQPASDAAAESTTGFAIAMVAARESAKAPAPAAKEVPAAQAAPVTQQPPAAAPAPSQAAAPVATAEPVTTAVVPSPATKPAASHQTQSARAVQKEHAAPKRDLTIPLLLVILGAGLLVAISRYSS